jgi:hypothetical protein
MANGIEGLFGGMTPADVRGLLQKERDARIRQAMADNLASGGDYFSSLIAKAGQQQAEAISGIVGGLTGLIPGATEIFPGLGQDPRMTKALKRETDRATLMKKYQDFSKDGISEQEANIIIDDLLNMGYMDEAAKFAQIYGQRAGLNVKREEIDVAKIGNLAKLQAARNDANKKAKLKFEGPLMQDAKGNIWQAAFTDDGQKIMFLLSGNPDGKEFNPEGARVVNAAEMGKLQIRDANEFIKAGNIALQVLPQTRELLSLATKIKSGGLAANINEVKRFFGVEPKDEAEFRTKSQRFLVENLKRLMDARPTDKDLEELSKALANLKQSQFANISIITDLIQKFEKEAEAGIYFANNPNGTVASFNEYLRIQMNKNQKKPDPLKIR